jgi:anaerobic magnesium-protoporphyrin IX monomethyl ester cyclase
VPFKCLSRADLLADDVVSGLARAGCRTVWIGAESGSQRILDAMEKGITVDQIRGAAWRLRAAGIEVGFFLQFGYPGEDWDDIERTLALVRECAPDDIGISVSYPLPGTKFHERVKAQLGDKRRWDDSDELAMMFEGSFTTPFYRRLHRFVHAQFRLARLRREGPRGLTWRRAAGALVGAASLPLHRAALRRLSFGRARPPLLGSVLSRDAAARPSDQAP